MVTSPGGERAPSCVSRSLPTLARAGNVTPPWSWTQVPYTTYRSRERAGHPPSFLVLQLQLLRLSGTCAVQRLAEHKYSPGDGPLSPRSPQMRAARVATRRDRLRRTMDSRSGGENYLGTRRERATTHLLHDLWYPRSLDMYILVGVVHTPPTMLNSSGVGASPEGLSDSGYLYL